MTEGMVAQDHHSLQTNGEDVWGFLPRCRQHLRGRWWGTDPPRRLPLVNQTERDDGVSGGQLGREQSGGRGDVAAGGDVCRRN